MSEGRIQALAAAATVLVVVLLLVFGRPAFRPSELPGPGGELAGAAPEVASPSRPTTRYFTPPPGAVARYPGWEVRPCSGRPANGDTLFSEQQITGRPGAGGFVRVAPVSGGHLDLRDGRLHVLGGEHLPYIGKPDGHPASVPPGMHPVSVLEGYGADGNGELVAASVRFSPTPPVRWEERPELGGGTDAGTGALTGAASGQRLAAVRTGDAQFREFETGEWWLSPCQRYRLAGAPGPEDLAVMLNLGGDGGFPGAAGFDAEGRMVAVVVSSGAVPWSLLGLPGTPPPQASQVQP